jgi:type I restriction enzyme, S subunit
MDNYQLTMNNYLFYKDSAIAWLGEVPKYWEEKRVKDVAILERGKFTHRPRNDPQMYDGIHPFIQTGDVARAVKYVTTYKQTLSDKGITVSKWFPKGTLVMAIAANIGDVAIVDFDTYFPDSIVAYKSRRNDTDYLFYLFAATKHELGKVKVTSTQDNLNLERLNSLIKFIPPLSEQKEIAQYLDTKTAQIDRKIDLLTQKANSYGELKRSLINETVTRGPERSVPMKDSGIIWIGEVPEHWEFKRLKDLSIIQNSNVDKKSIPSEIDIRLCNYVDVYKNEFINSSLDFMRATATKSEIAQFMIEEGDVFITKDSETCDDIAVPALATESLEGVICGYHLARIRTNRKAFLGAYLFRLFQSKQYGFRFVISAKGITRVGLGQSAISDAITPVPPLSEQKAIADYLDSKTAQIDQIIQTINTQIEKLKELRKTLINDVVTGKIRVIDN